MNTASSHVRDPFRWQRSLEGSIRGHSKLSTDRPGHLCLLSQSPLCWQLQHETAFSCLRLHAYKYKLNVSSVAIFVQLQMKHIIGTQACVHLSWTMFQLQCWQMQPDPPFKGLRGLTVSTWQTVVAHHPCTLSHAFTLARGTVTHKWFHFPCPPTSNRKERITF